MRRREFIALLGGAAIAWPLATRAQPSERVRRIGVLFSAPVEGHPYLLAFLDEMRRLGWEDGRNLRLDIRGGLYDLPQLRAAAEELLAQQPDVLVGYTSVPTRALRETGTRLPVVFVMIADPIALGVVESLARQGGNFTGVSHFAPDLAAKRL